MDAITHASAVIDAVTRKPIVDRAPYADVSVDDLVHVAGFTGPQECRIWYDVDYEGFTPFAVFRYVTLDVQGVRLKFYERDLSADAWMRVEDILHEEMECAE